ncbi:MAG: alpha/beta hydrolase domain-containing protein, partial [Candidatus Sulfopaludibacter sp.]|nr:alpha/beta hydrolase domain-containing protein [Candidatus Sulfopaludibacter sp.]
AARVTTMFLRSSVVKKGGKTYRYWKLVENVRTDTGPGSRLSLTWETFPISAQPAGKLSADAWASRKWPRLSLQERYKTHQGYVDVVRKAAAKAVGERFLLPADAARLVAEAEASDVLK